MSIRTSKIIAFKGCINQYHAQDIRKVMKDHLVKKKTSFKSPICLPDL